MIQQDIQNTPHAAKLKIKNAKISPDLLKIKTSRRSKSLNGVWCFCEIN